MGFDSGFKGLISFFLILTPRTYYLQAKWDTCRHSAGLHWTGDRSVAETLTYPQI